MAEIFYNPYKKTETWTAQGALLMWTAGTIKTEHNFVVPNPMSPVLMITQLAIQYQRAIQPIFPIAASGKELTKINMVGAPRGTLTIGSIFSPSTTNLNDFFSKVGSACKNENNTVSLFIAPFGTSCKTDAKGNTSITESNNNVSFTLKGVDLESVGVQIQGGEVATVNMPLTFSFTSMDYTGE